MSDPGRRDAPLAASWQVSLSPPATWGRMPKTPSCHVPHKQNKGLMAYQSHEKLEARESKAWRQVQAAQFVYVLSNMRLYLGIDHAPTQFVIKTAVIHSNDERRHLLP